MVLPKNAAHLMDGTCHQWGVFNRVNTKPTLLDRFLPRQVAFHGHLVRKGGITFDLMIGRLHGTRPRGRPRTTWLKDLTTQANISYTEAITIPRGGVLRRTPDEWVYIAYLVLPYWSILHFRSSCWSKYSCVYTHVCVCVRGCACVHGVGDSPRNGTQGGLMDRNFSM